jgi:hypothetical protein
MSEEVESLRRRVCGLERKVVGVGIYCAVLTIYLLLSSPGRAVKAAAQPDKLTVRRLAVVDAKGTERVVIAAPLPDPIIHGTRVPRDGAVSGILIFDPKGNERGGYVTSDTSDMTAFLSLDSENDQVFTAYANADSGATVWVANEKHDAVAFSTHTQPVFEIIRNKKIVYKRPVTAPDLKQ